MQDRIDASIVILAKNEVEFAGRCLEGVFSQNYPGRYEVIFIDSGSTDGTLDITSGFPVRLVQIRPEKFHHAGTRNHGARLAAGEIVVFLNADAVPLDDRWLAELLRPFENERVMGAYSCHVARPDAWLRVRRAHEWIYHDRSQTLTAEDYGDLGMRIFLFSTVSAAVRRPYLLENPFAEHLHVYEDRYLAHRIITQSLATAYCADSRVEHSHNILARKIFRRYFDTGLLDQLIGVHDFGNRRSRILRQGFGHMRHELGGLGLWGMFRHLPGMLLYDACKFLGYTLGKNHRRLPRCLVRKLSIFQKNAMAPTADHQK